MVIFCRINKEFSINGPIGSVLQGCGSTDSQRSLATE